MQDNTNSQPPRQETFPPANIGNASNPAPNDDAGGGSQLIDKRGEKYLREVSSPEDYPDEQDWEEANKIIEREKGDDSSKDQ